MRSAEWQARDLLSRVAGVLAGLLVFSMPEVPRSETGRDHVEPLRAVLANGKYHIALPQQGQAVWN